MHIEKLSSFEFTALFPAQYTVGEGKGANFKTRKFFNYPESFLYCPYSSWCHKYSFYSRAHTNRVIPSLVSIPFPNRAHLFYFKNFWLFVTAKAWLNFEYFVSSYSLNFTQYDGLIYLLKTVQNLRKPHLQFYGKNIAVCVQCSTVKCPIIE